MVFSLFWWLGYASAFESPTLEERANGESISQPNYGPLNDIAPMLLTLNSCAEPWDDLLRAARSLKSGVVQAISIMRTAELPSKPPALGVPGERARAFRSGQKGITICVARGRGIHRSAHCGDRASRTKPIWLRRLEFHEPPGARIVDEAHVSLECQTKSGRIKRFS